MKFTAFINDIITLKYWCNIDKNWSFELTEFFTSKNSNELKS